MTSESQLDPRIACYEGCACAVPSCEAECPCVERFGANYVINPSSGKAILRNLRAHLETNAAAPPVFECNSMCKCSDCCLNRQVQNGVAERLEVFECGDVRGLGVRSLDAIEAGRFVCEYAGDVMLCSEASQRAANQTADDMNYLIAVREHSIRGITVTYVDPAYNGNVGRFLNHSCDPNLVMVPVRADSEVPMLALFSRKSIAPGEELTFDYGGRDDHVNENSKSARKRCYCGASDCRGYLPLNELLFPSNANET